MEEDDNAEKRWSTPSGISDGIPVTLPTLAKAQAISERAAIIGFDFSNIDGVLEKLDEESEELRLAIGKIPENSAIAEMDHFWEEAKKQEGFFSKK